MLMKQNKTISFLFLLTNTPIKYRASMAKQPLHIAQSAAELTEIVAQHQNPKAKLRLNALLILKNEPTIKKIDLAQRLNISQATLRTWLKYYAEGGIKQLLHIQTSGGAPTKLPMHIRHILMRKISSPSSFKNFKEVQQFLKTQHDIHLPYSTVHDILHYKMGIKSVYGKLVEKKT